MNGRSKNNLKNMIKSRTIILFVIFNCILPNVLCWKPITGTPTSFSITQSHPPVGSSSNSGKSEISRNSRISTHNRNTILDTTGGGQSIGLTGSGDSYGDDSILGEEPLIDIDEASGYGIKSSGRLFSSSGFSEDACSVDKYAFDHEGTVQYKHKLPKMEQFTICFWSRFTNHSGDHTIFTYSVDDEPREIQIWVANAKGSSYISMAIHGQSLYRLNYPLKMREWHHTCTSWNGKTGEWQLWMKSERVGRGFHNRLVNHDISPHGILFSGGPSITGHTADSLHFELTLLQIYKVALTAGKAHRDHKHHHVHHFLHDGLEPMTTPAPTPPPPPPAPINALLANGQIQTRVRINLSGAQPTPPPPGIPSQVVGGIIPGLRQQQQQHGTINTNFENGQFHSAERLLSQQLLGASLPPQPSGQAFLQLGPASPVTFPNAAQQQQQQQQQQLQNPFLIGNPSSVQFIDNDSKFIFKRESSGNEKVIKKREIPKEKKLNKRGLVMLGDGSIIDDTLLAQQGFQLEGLAQFGLPQFKEDLQNRMNIEDEIKEHDREPAEDEVKAVMEICTSCDTEPFKGAVAMTWKGLRVSQNGALKGRSVGGCGYF